ncbi:MAG: peptide ABC transporter substrate-binding protein [Eubacteriales bacterium]|nr:peptide ABC transporter substrate-binding protein [Eubacteriales bacterium]MDD3073650.1 peptide ABC transporter substrate-binding protein [Eubacteriales bacterium]MDD4078819.1 peptide ABC transporter substrate-binding protein [Eubacteriales bacterium]MDD4769491.1 peptide ABC transporter substrate-binding protein [Eubacteriales bacterium]
MKKSLAMLFVIMLIVASMAGCTGKKDDGMEIRYNVGTEPETMDVHLSTGIPEATIMLQIYEGLTRMDALGQPKAALAKSWDISEDKTEYTFHLRESKWANGETLTAHDLVWSWKRALDPELAADYAYMLYPIKGAEAYNSGEGSVSDIGIEAVDDLTLKVKLVGPTPYFLSLVSFKTYYPVYKKNIEADPEGWHLSVETTVGNGPFKMVKWADNKMEFVPNEHYWDAGAVKADRLLFTMVENASTELTMFENGELHMTNTVPGQEIPRLQKMPELKIFPYLGTYYYIFNLEKPPFDDIRVRKALTLAIDRQAIVDNVTQGGQLPAFAFVPPGIPEPDGSDFREKGGDYFQEDLALAKELLAAAGYPDGEGFPAFEILYNTSEGHKLIAEAIQEMWKKNLGITNVTLTNQEWGIYLNSRDEGAFTVARAGWIGDYNDPNTFLDMWTTGNGNNNSRFSNAEYDRLVAECLVEGNMNTRNDKLHRLEDIFMGEMSIMPIYYYTLPAMVSQKLKGYSSIIIGGVDFKTAYITE